MESSSTAGCRSRMPSRSSRSRRNHGRASSGVGGGGRDRHEAAQPDPVEGGQEVGRRGRVLGRDTRPAEGEVDLEQRLDRAAGAGRAPGQPARGALPRDGVHDVGEIGHVMRGVGLQRPDVVPPHAGIRRSRAACRGAPSRSSHRGRARRRRSRRGSRRRGTVFVTTIRRTSAGSRPAAAAASSSPRRTDLQVARDLLGTRAHRREHTEGGGRARGSRRRGKVASGRRARPPPSFARGRAGRVGTASS